MRSAIKDSPGETKTIAGCVGADGSIIWGIGFRAKRLALGQYELCFPGFAFIYAIDVTCGNVAGSFTAGTIANPNYASVYMWAPNQNYHDMAFTFQATGIPL